VDRQDRVARVVGLIVKGLELRFVQGFAECRQAKVEFLVDVFAFLGQFEQDVEIFLLLIEARQELNFAIQTLFALLQGLGFFLVLPNFGSAEFPA